MDKTEYSFSIKHKLLISAALLTALIISLCGCNSSMTNKAKEQASMEEASTLTLAVYGGSNLEQAVKAYNETNPEYRIKTVEYRKSGSGLEDAILQLNLDFISGKAPDIIDFEFFPNKSSYAAQGLLADMSEYFHEEFNSEDYFIIDKVNGNKMYFFPAAFYIDAYAMIDRSPGKELDIGLYYSIMETEAYEREAGLSREEYLFGLSLILIDLWTNYEASTFNIDRNCLVELLNFLKSLPENTAYFDESIGTMLGNRDRFLVPVNISSPLNIADNEAAAGTRLTYVGLPGPQEAFSCTYYLSGTMAVNSASKHPQAAWDFIRFVLSEKCQNSLSIQGIPVKKSATEKYIGELKEPYKEFEGKELIIHDDGTFSVDGQYMDALYDPRPQITDLQEKQFYALIENTDLAYEYDPDIYRILCEEADRFLNNNQTAEEAADGIIKKATIYLNENADSLMNGA